MAESDDVEARKAAARFAVANTEIEGGAVSAETKALLDRWVAGELDDDALIEEARRRWGPGAPNPCRK